MRYYFHIDTRPTCIHLHDFFDDPRIERTDRIEDADVIVVGGGDGFMLESMRALHSYDIPFLGLNCGTLGFMLNPIETLTIEQFIQPSFQRVTVDAVDVDISDEAGNTQTNVFFNDCVLGGSVLDYFSFVVEHPEKVLDIVGTGLVVNTMLGSTGYALNLGQPIIPVDSNLWGIVGIASAPFRYGFLNPADITIQRSGRNPLVIGLDGYNCVYHDAVSLRCKPSAISATLLFFGSEPFTTKRLLLAEEKMGR